MPFVRCRDIDIYYERHAPEGGSAGTPVLWISGSNGDLRYNANRGKGPLEQAFATIMFDQRGLGQTTIAPAPYTMQDYADDAEALLDALHVDRCHVVGVSFGGMVAQEFVLRHPARVDRLVLACTSSGGPGGASWDLQEIHGLTGDERMRMWLPKLDVRNDVSAQPWQLAPGLAPVVAAIAARPPLTAQGLAGTAGQLEARRRHDTWDRLPSVTAETLCIGGRFDGQAPPENMERLAARIPGAKLELCDGGHLFLAQDPTAWPKIVDFLSAAA